MKILLLNFGRHGFRKFQMAERASSVFLKVYICNAGKKEKLQTEGDRSF